MFKKALESMEDGESSMDNGVNNISYTDDTVIITNTEEGLQRIIKLVNN